MRRKWVAATVGWWNKKLCQSCGKAAGEGKGNQGGKKVQNQLRGRTTEQELVVQVTKKDIKGEDQDRSGVRSSEGKERSSRAERGGERIPSYDRWREGCRSLEDMVLEAEPNPWI